MRRRLYLVAFGLVLFISGLILNVCSLCGIAITNSTRLTRDSYQPALTPGIRQVYAGNFSLGDTVTLDFRYSGLMAAGSTWSLNAYVNDNAGTAVGNRTFIGGGYDTPNATQAHFEVPHDGEYRVYVSYQWTFNPSPQVSDTIDTTVSVQKHSSLLIPGLILVIVGLILLLIGKVLVTRRRAGA